MPKTTVLKTKEITRQTHTIDASGKILGRLAVEVAKLLLGKDKPLNAANLVAGDNVVVINASQVAVTGNKRRQKIYVRHSGYPGGRREETLGSLLGRQPTEVIRLAVWGMLPKNKLRNDRMRHLKIYAKRNNAN